jgi:hypothetical protein
MTPKRSKPKDLISRGFRARFSQANAEQLIRGNIEKAAGERQKRKLEHFIAQPGLG